VIIESVIFQGIVCITQFKGINKGRLLKLVHFIQETISVMNPVLIYYYQVEVEKNWRWLCSVRGDEWAKQVGLTTDERFRKAAFAWSKSQEVCNSIFNEWNIPKLIIKNKNYLWQNYLNRILSFLQI
jgi:hypothetical protein